MAQRKGKNAAAPGAAAVPRKPSATGGAFESELERLRALLNLMREHDLTVLEIGPDSRSVKMSKERGMTGMAPAAVPVAAAEAAPAGAPSKADRDSESFLSPMVGTYYRAPSPEAPAYVSVGDTVEPGQTLCVIEAMKVFNEIKAEWRGVILEILVENGEAVEYGQPLFAIRKMG